MTIDNPRPPIPVDKIVFGLILLAVGLITFGAGIDLWHPVRLVRLWPLILIFIGLASEFEAIRNRKSDGGSSFLLGAGVWLLFGSLHLFGLSMRSAFPLGVIVVGLGTVLHALIDRPVVKEKKNEHESQSL